MAATMAMLEPPKPRERKPAEAQWASEEVYARAARNRFSPEW